MSSTGGRQRPNRENRAAAAAHERQQPRQQQHADEQRVHATGAASSAAASPPTSDAGLQYGQAQWGMSATMPGSQVAAACMEGSLDLDVTVLAFAQWVTEMKARSQTSSHQMQAEMSIIRNAITTNNTEMSDFKRHSASIQQQMQNEIVEIRESLSNVFMEITNAVRNNAGADQDIKLKIQSLNEQAVRNETAFAQLADAADQSQTKLRNAVQEMQHSSERMRDELVGLNRHTEGLETNLTERADGIAAEIEQLSQDLRVQLERRKEHLKKMVNDVCGISNSLTGWMGDFSDQKRGTSDMQNKIQSSLYVLDQAQPKPALKAAIPFGAQVQPDAAARARLSPQPQRTAQTVAMVPTHILPSGMAVHAGARQFYR